jgi:trans-aconitate methyltransferase
METTSEAYKEHLENKYLPGRSLYLKTFFYPKIMRQFDKEEISDLGCGTGEFLKYLKSKKRAFRGADNNPHLVELCQKMGFDVIMDDVTKLENIKAPIMNAIVDNVLEHLDMDQINSFFASLKAKIRKGGTLVVIVPHEKGYTYDPTHKTFVNPTIIREMCTKHGATLERNFLHPFNMELIGRILYLNMQVFTIKF